MTEAKAAAQTCSEQPSDAASGPKKRAVVMIHGMGDQSPMETLRSFVAAVWTSLPPGKDGKKRLTWSLRDRMSENLELWRIATNEDAEDVRTDFFEFYWADMMEDTRLSSVLSWFKRLFVRPLGRVPPPVRPPWYFGLVGIFVLLLLLTWLAWLAFFTLATGNVSVDRAMEPLLYVVMLVFFFWYLRRRVLIEVVGDAARYLTAAPSNIAARKRIRLAGLKLLEHLHCNPQYNRIIIVAHSLGTVVGYDLINFWWSEINGTIHHPASEQGGALERVEKAGQAVLADASTLPDFRNAQRDYFHEVRDLSKDKWKISDFVTLGSPLTYAHFLLVNDGEPLLQSEWDAIEADWVHKWWKGLDGVSARVAALFQARATQREFTLCPPITETPDKITYDPRPQGGDYRVPHHGAPFAAVRWTNIYAPRKNILWGDAVGGPVAPLFGAGVKDIKLEGTVAKDFIAHTHYWDVGRADGVHLVALRAAVNLFDGPDENLWMAYDEACAALPGEVAERR